MLHFEGHPNQSLFKSGCIVLSCQCLIKEAVMPNRGKRRRINIPFDFCIRELVGARGVTAGPGNQEYWLVNCGQIISSP